MVNTTTRPLHPQERDPVSTIQEVGWIPGLVSTGEGNMALDRIWSPDRPARSE